LCTDPSILIVADRDPLDLVATYMNEHFDTAVTWTQVYDGSFPAWRCGRSRDSRRRRCPVTERPARTPSGRDQPEAGEYEEGRSQPCEPRHGGGITPQTEATVDAGFADTRIIGYGQACTIDVPGVFHGTVRDERADRLS